MAEIDELIERIKDKTRLRDEALKECEAELDRGRTGLAQYRAANGHHIDLEQLVQEARFEIDVALKELGA
jgi:phage shock protein A